MVASPGPHDHAYTDPAVLVGFNPQPEPPAHQVLRADLSHPPDPGIVLHGLVEGRGELLLALGGGGREVHSIAIPPLACGNRGAIQLWPIDGEVSLSERCARSLLMQAELSDGTVLDLRLTVTGNGKTPPAELVGFNPQPEPPAMSAIGLAVDFADADVSYADVALQVSIDERALDLY